jgi:AcrR family transcriptional regulator
MSPTRPELPREFVAAHKRRRMMDAIAELTAESGYEATKIADVVRRAGVARKTLYDNFDGKEELFITALDASLAELKAAVEEACAEHEGSWAGGVEAGIGALLGFIAEKPAAARMCLIESISATGSSTKRYHKAIEDFVAILARQAPRRRDLPATIEESLVGGVTWILQQQLRRGDGAGPAELLPELSQFVLSPYQGVRKVGGTGRRK